MRDQDKTREQLVAENTELRRRVAAVEKALQENHSATALLQVAPLGIHECDTEGRITFVSPSQEAITGYTADELVGTYIWDRIEPGPERDALPAYLEHLVSEQPAPTPFFAKNIRKNGEVFDARVDWSYKRNPQGKVTGFVCIVSDITERKWAEQAVQENERRFRTLFQDSSVGTIVASPDGQFLQVNRAFCEFLGYSEQELVGKTVLSVTHPEDRETTSQAIYQAAHSGPRIQRLEKRYLHKSGRAIWGEASSNLICNADGKPDYFITQVLDITARKQAEEELAKSKAILQAAIECLPFDFFAIGDDGRYMLENAVCRAHWGRLVGKTPEGMAPNEDVRALWLDNNRRAFAGEKVENVVAVTIKGEERFVCNILTPIRDETQSYGILGVNVDITERKRAEETLKQAHDELEQRVKERTADLAKANETLDVFRRFAETSWQGFGMSDLEGKIAYVNPALCRLYGEGKPEDLIGKNSIDYYPEEWRERRKNEVLPVLEREGHWQGEMPILARQGTLIQTLHHVFLLRDEEGRPIRRCVVVTDITERKRAEEALRQSHEELRAIYDSMADGLLIGDRATGRLLRTNPAMCRMLGYSEDELLSMSVRDIHPAEAVLDVLEDFRSQQMEQRIVTQNRPMLRKDGTVFYADLSNVRISYQGRPSVLGIFRDVTEKMQAEAALAESEKKYRLLIETTGTGYVILDGHGGIIDANAEYLRISGHRTLEEILGRTVVEWTASYDVDRNAKEVEKCYQKGFVRQLEIDYVHLDGKIIPIDINATCLDTEDGRTIVCLCRDITERREAQKALERERQSLWNMLQASDHERQTISYEIHDGLAQYLAGATMQFQAHDALRENSPEEAETAYQTAVELVRQAHFEARRLISEVRPPVIDENGLETAISHLVHELRPRGGPQIECRSDVQFGRLPSILENALYRIAQEALTNACKHSKSKRVMVTMTQEGQDVRLEVQDWGIGFDPGSVEGGHFGLEGIRQRVRLLGGRLTIESTPGSGTLVQVVVPILERQAER